MLEREEEEAVEELLCGAGPPAAPSALLQQWGCCMPVGVMTHVPFRKLVCSFLAA